MSACTHDKATAKVSVHPEVDGAPRQMYVSLRCAACGWPFQFLGVGVEGSADGPTVDIQAQELRVPVAPKAVAPKSEKPGRLQ